jgi:hypothetical protein
MRLAKSFTIDPEVSNFVDTTRGQKSASERVNELLRRAILEEQHERLEIEAAAFFANVPKAEREEARAFRKASIRAITRDE